MSASHAAVTLAKRSFSLPEIGAPNPLPAVAKPPETPYQIKGNVPQDIIDGSTYGNPANLYPYQPQDAYDRVRTPHELRTRD